jgi:hypothetical protein
MLQTTVIWKRVIKGYIYAPASDLGRPGMQTFFISHRNIVSSSTSYLSDSRQMLEILL